MEQMVFNGFLFPILPGLKYFFDGSNSHPDQMFIEDADEMFTVSFENGMKCREIIEEKKADRQYEITDFRNGSKYICLCYPKYESSSLGTVGYFNIELTDDCGSIHNLPGQLYISQPKKFPDGIREYTILHQFLGDIQLSEKEV